MNSELINMTRAWDKEVMDLIHFGDSKFFFVPHSTHVDQFTFHYRIGSCLACVYRVMDARGKFGEHERSVRVARGDSREQL